MIAIRKFCMGMPNSLGIFHGDAKFSREICMGCRILCSVGDTKSTEEVPKFLGNLTQGCRSLVKGYRKVKDTSWAGAGTRLVSFPDRIFHAGPPDVSCFPGPAHGVTACLNWKSEFLLYLVDQKTDCFVSSLTSTIVLQVLYFRSRVLLG